MKRCSLRGRVVDRLIFNYRVPSSRLSPRLPGGFAPQEIDGSAVVSFCVLRVDRVGVGRLTPALWPSGIHCAFRAAVLDRAGAPAVYLTGRHSASALGSWLTRVAGAATHARVHARLEAVGDEWDVEVRDTERRLLFEAQASGTPAGASSLFPRTEDFVDFLRQGVRSFVPARRAGHLARVDIEKAEVGFRALAVRRISSPFLDRWIGPDARFDSAYRTGDGRYEWRFRGLVAA